MAKKKTSPCVYIGPSLRGLSQNTVFTSDKLPPHVADMVKANENIRGLIVPVERLQDARRNIHVKGNILHTYALKVLNKEQ